MGMDVQAHHRRMLVGGAGGSMSPTWAPDGRTIAYIAHPSSSSPVTAIRTADVATGRVRTVLASDQPGQPLLLPGGQFLALGWMHTPV